MSTVLAVNAGSSSLKLAVFEAHAVPARPDPVRLAAVQVDRIGQDGGRLVVRGPDGSTVRETAAAARDHADALARAMAAVDAARHVDAVGHRVVRGAVRHRRPERLTPALIDELRKTLPIDPEHLPQTLAILAAAERLLPGVPQVACFDTAFHAGMPRVAQMYGLPRALFDRGLARFGFHGLSCEHVLHALQRMDPAAARGRLVVAHLGNGASLTAVRDGAGLDTTMGFSPTSGLVMGTRVGDLDPSAVLYLLETEGMTPDAVRVLLNRQSGLLGVSGASADMRDLLAREAADPAAADAVALFCYTARRHLGALVASLDGLDTLVFTGGIGEHAASIRARIAAGTALGIDLDERRNAAHAPIISSARSRVTVRVMPADEELTIARHLVHLLDTGARHVSI